MTELKPHRHAALIMTWAELTAKGEVGAGWWDVEQRWYPNPEFEQYPQYLPVVFDSNCEYRIVKTAKHPDNQKKEIDWSRIPTGAMTDKGMFLGLFEHYLCIHSTDGQYTHSRNMVKLAPMTMWFEGEPSEAQKAMCEIERADVRMLKPKVEVFRPCWRIKGSK